MKNEELQVGKEAICVDDKGHRVSQYIAVGHKYIIHGLMQSACSCAPYSMALINPNKSMDGTRCTGCGYIMQSIGSMSWFRAYRFRPINATDALMDKLESELKEEFVELMK